MDFLNAVPSSLLSIIYAVISPAILLIWLSFVPASPLRIAAGGLQSIMNCQLRSLSQLASSSLSFAGGRISWISAIPSPVVGFPSSSSSFFLLSFSSFSLCHSSEGKVFYCFRRQPPFLSQLRYVALGSFLPFVPLIVVLHTVPPIHAHCVGKEVLP